MLNSKFLYKPILIKKAYFTYGVPYVNPTIENQETKEDVILENIYVYVKNSEYELIVDVNGGSNIIESKKIYCDIGATLNQILYIYFTNDNNTYEVVNANIAYSIFGFTKEGSKDLVVFKNEGNKNLIVNNCEISFPTYSSGEDAQPSDYINKSIFGVVYTDNYAQNRLILSGNPEIRNCDWWTESVNVYATSDDVIRDDNLHSDDFLYFPDTNYCYYGKENKSIAGYDVEANGKLIVFKESYNTDSSIYFRDGEKIYKKQDAVTGEYIYSYKLNMSSGNSSVYPVNRNCICNFNGTTVFLSNDKHIEGLEVKEAVKDNTRYASSRSKYIDGKLRQYDLDYLRQNAFMFVNKYWLYVVIGKDIYCCRYDEYDSSTGQYERYRLGTKILLENEIFTFCSEILDTLLLGTNLGSIFSLIDVIGNADYEDNRKVWLDNNEITNSSINKEKAKLITDNDLIYSTYYVEWCQQETAAELLATKNTTILITNEFSVFINIGIKNKYKFYIKTSDNNIVPINTISLDGQYLNITIADVLSSSTFTIFRKQCLEDVITTQIVNIDGINKLNTYYNIDNDKYIVKFYNYGEAVNSAFIVHKENIDAIYITAPMAMGTLSYFKNIYQFTLTNDTRKPSELYVATISNSIPIAEAQEIGLAENDAYMFSLDHFDFNSVSLTQDYVAARAYTKYRNIFRQRFTDFVFYNKNNTNAVLSNMTVIYTITSPVVGGE